MLLLAVVGDIGDSVVLSKGALLASTVTIADAITNKRIPKLISLFIMYSFSYIITITIINNISLTNLLSLAFIILLGFNICKYLYLIVKYANKV